MMKVMYFLEKKNYNPLFVCFRSRCTSAVGFDEVMEDIDMRHQPVDESLISDIISHSAQIIRKLFYNQI